MTSRARYKTGSIIDNPDQRIVTDIDSFTSTSLALSFTLLNAGIDLVSFSGQGVAPIYFLTHFTCPHAHSTWSRCASALPPLKLSHCTPRNPLELTLMREELGERRVDRRRVRL